MLFYLSWWSWSPVVVGSGLCCPEQIVLVVLLDLVVLEYVALVVLLV